MFLVQEVKVKLTYKKSWENYRLAFFSLKSFAGLIFVDLIINIFKYLGPYLASMMQRFAKIVNRF